MITILKRTTAIAALAALPLAPVAVQAQSQADQAETTPETQSATEYGIPSGQLPSAEDAGAKDAAGGSSDSAGMTTQDAGESADRTGESSDAKDRTAADEAQTEPETQDAARYGVDGEVTTGGQNTEQGQQKVEGANQNQTGDQMQAEGAGQEQPTQQMQVEGTEQDKAGAPQQAEGAEPGQAADRQQAEGAEPDRQQAATGDESDAIVARVGNADIMRSDVLGVIETLPPELQQQPAEMLIPLAVEQLVLRELILQEARDAGLESDPDVEALLADSDDASEESRENAMVQVWLDRELAGAVTDTAVQETYGAIESEFGDQAPPLEQIRPQIEQELRRLAFVELSEELQTGADVTLFGPDGQPIAE